MLKIKIISIKLFFRNINNNTLKFCNEMEILIIYIYQEKSGKKVKINFGVFYVAS
jgi:hypothetical protein